MRFIKKVCNRIEDTLMADVVNDEIVILWNDDIYDESLMPRGSEGWHTVTTEGFREYVEKQGYPKKVRKMLFRTENFFPKVISELSPVLEIQRKMYGT